MDFSLQEFFEQIVRHIAPKKSAGAIDKLLETLDPFHHDVVTFSDAASCLLGDLRSKKSSPNNSTPPPLPPAISNSSQLTKPRR